MSGEPGAPPHVLRRLAARTLRLLVVVVLIALLLSLVRRVDWGQVVDALDRLTVANFIVIGLLMIARQCINSIPLALFIEGLGLRRAMANDLTGYVVGTLAPAPSDMVLRMTMLRGWGVDASRGAAGLALNALVYYIGRFFAPIAGLVVLLIWSDWDPIYAWSALGGAIVAGVLVGLLIAVGRGERHAFEIGRRLCRVAARITRRELDPDRWGTEFARFQQISSRGVSERFAAAMLSVAALLAVDAAILVVSLRFVGVPASMLPAPVIVAAFLCVYPATALPLAGLGFLDAAAIALFHLPTEAANQDALAAFVIWRIATLLGPLVLGTGTLLYWRYGPAAGARAPRPAARSHEP